MKLLGNLLLTVSLITGMISAATSYLAFLGEDAEALAEDDGYARMKASAGAKEPAAEAADELRQSYEAGEMSAEAYVAALRAVDPVLGTGEDEDGTVLTAERQQVLREAGVEAVYTKSFSFARWRYWWVFVLSAAGLLTGSLLVRRADKREVEAAAAAAGESTEGSPEQMLAELGQALTDLRRDLATTSREASRLELIVSRLNDAQKEQVTSFIEARPLLVGKLGLGGYAELMDRFAAGERQINRAWSAAADGYLAESEECLGVAEEWVEAARERLAKG